MSNPTSSWPTPLAPDGTAPPVKDLLASGDLFLTRQTAYLLMVAKRMQALEYEIDSFQVAMGTVTLPLLTMFEGKWPQLVFTWSEAWDDDSAAATIQSWVDAVHGAGVDPQASISVVSNWPCDAVAALESVEFIVMHVKGLPGDEPVAETPPPDPGTPDEARRLADDFVRMVREQTGAELAFEPATLDAVDSAVDKVRATGLSEEDARGVLYAIGCYVGEVLVRHAGGAWCAPVEVGMEAVCQWPLVVRMPSGAGANPIGKAFKRFREGETDSLAFFYHATTSMERR